MKTGGHESVVLLGLFQVCQHYSNQQSLHELYNGVKFFKKFTISIHRLNLIAMGVLPLEFEKGQGINELNIESTDQFSLLGLNHITNENKKVLMKIHKQTGDIIEVSLNARLDVPEEVNFWKNGGILPTAYKEA